MGSHGRVAISLKMDAVGSALACTFTGVGPAAACTTSGGSGLALALVVIGALIGLVFGIYQYFVVAGINLPQSHADAQSRIDEANSSADAPLAQVAGDDVSGNSNEVSWEMFNQLNEIYGFVNEGASAFLASQYTLCAKFTVVFAIVVLVLCSSSTEGEGCKRNNVTQHMECDSFNHAWKWGTGALTAISFATGAFTSILAGYIGMTVAVFANARVTVEAVKPGAAGWRGSFNAAFIAGSVMGFALCGLALVVLFILIQIYTSIDGYDISKPEEAKKLFECIAGYGLGGSSMALFGRVGGGIFTKAADVGADLSGKVAGVVVQVDGVNKTELLDEDSPYTPATIADNVGDDVGDVAGMGSDLFGSFAEASCAALVISASSPELASVGTASFMFPLLVSAAGIVVCMLTSFVATHVQTVAAHKDVEGVLKVQLFVSALLMSLATLPLAYGFLPNKFTFNDLYEINTDPHPSAQICHWWGAWICVACGLWGGCLIGFITEYYTSHSYTPVQDVAASCETGAATNIIYGLALGYLSCIIPITLLAINVYVAFSLCGMYGVALAALGMLGTLSTCLSIDVYGPIADNAGGLAEMAEFPGFVRDKTDALDAAGNPSAAIGKGFAIGSAALVSLALFGGFVSRLANHTPLRADGTHVPVVIDVLRPITFAFLFLGAMLPYWFTAFCMKSVGVAAGEMVNNVKDQFNRMVNWTDPDTGVKTNEKFGLLIVEKKMIPEYDECIAISTEASLREMVAPALLLMTSPVL